MAADRDTHAVAGTVISFSCSLLWDPITKHECTTYEKVVSLFSRLRLKMLTGQTETRLSAIEARRTSHRMMLAPSGSRTSDRGSATRADDPSSRCRRREPFPSRHAWPARLGDTRRGGRPAGAGRHVSGRRQWHEGPLLPPCRLDWRTGGSDRSGPVLHRRRTGARTDGSAVVQCVLGGNARD